MLRSGVVLSKKGGALGLMLLPFRLFVGGPLGKGDQWLSWVHIEDEVRAIRFLIENQAAHGPFNISAQPLTNKEFARYSWQGDAPPNAFPCSSFHAAPRAG